MTGWAVFKVHFFTLGACTFGVIIIILTFLESLRKINQVWKNIFWINITKLIFSLIISILGVGLFTAFLFKGIHEGSANALDNLEQYNISFKNEHNLIPFMSGGAQIHDQNGVIYNGYIISGTLDNGIIYASDNVDSIPASYVIQNSVLKIALSFPTTYYDKFLSCMKLKDPNFSFSFKIDDPKAKECTNLAFDFQKIT
jgi:hypothetical protein